MDVTGKVPLLLFNKSKFRNGTKTFLERKLNLGFSAPLTSQNLSILGPSSPSQSKFLATPLYKRV